MSDRPSYSELDEMLSLLLLQCNFRFPQVKRKELLDKVREINGK